MRTNSSPVFSVIHFSPRTAMMPLGNTSATVTVIEPVRVLPCAALLSPLVARGAQKTDGEQSLKGLLLARTATINAKPELEIFADDVKCAHGAAIGELDETARFYMAARGIPPEAARRLLVRAFIADAFVALDDEDERERLLNAALDALGERA